MGTGVYRAPLRSRLDGVDPALALDRAFRHGVCGVGGRLSSAPTSAEEALRMTADEHDERTARRLERFMAVPDGSRVWTRDEDGRFRAGTLTGPWRYDADPGGVRGGPGQRPRLRLVRRTAPGAPGAGGRVCDVPTGWPELPADPVGGAGLSRGRTDTTQARHTAATPGAARPGAGRA